VEHLRHLLPFVKRYRWQLLFGLLCAACSAVLTALIPQVLRLAVDELNDHGVVAADLLRYGLIMIGLALVDSLFRFGQRMLVAGASYLVEFDIRDALFRRLLLLDQGFYSQAHTGDLMTRVTNDLSAVRQFLGPGVNSLMTAVLFIGFAGTLLFRTNTTLALLVLALLPVITLLFVIVGGRMRKIFRNVQDQFGGLSTRAQENFSGIRTIKAYAQEQAEIRLEFARLKQEHMDFDAAINAMIAMGCDALQIQRMKKKKLALKDRLKNLEDRIIPDIIA